MDTKQLQIALAELRERFCDARGVSDADERDRAHNLLLACADVCAFALDQLDDGDVDDDDGDDDGGY